jgi:hypothetical protein
MDFLQGAKDVAAGLTAKAISMKAPISKPAAADGQINGVPVSGRTLESCAQTGNEIGRAYSSEGFAADRGAFFTRRSGG